MSQGCPRCWTGNISAIFLVPSLSGLSLVIPQVPYIGPGATPFTLMPLGPSSTAKCFVSASTAALAAPACDCKATPWQCRVAEMLMIEPLNLPDCATALLMLKVPTVSIYSTVLKPFVVSLSKGAKKLPAAPFTKMSIDPHLLIASLATSTHYSKFLTSQVLPATFGDICLRELTAAYMFFSFLEAISTKAPWTRNYLAIPKQMPVAPPVMIATFP